MNTKFPMKPLSSVCDIYSGYAFKSTDLDNMGIPVIKIANIQDRKVLQDCPDCLPESLFSDKLHKYLMKKDDILIAMTGAGSVGRIGKMRKVNRQYLVNQRVAIVRTNSQFANPEFLYQVISNRYYEEMLYNLALGAGQPNLSAATIGSIEIPFPSLKVQNKIASILSAYDDLIENNTSRIKILEEMAQNLYREWFIKFRFPGHERVKMVESELGMIPEGWKVKLVSDTVIRLKSGNKYTQDNVISIGKIPVVDQSRAEVLGYHNNTPDHIASVEKPIIIFGDHTCKMQLMVEPFSVGPNVIPFTSINGIPLQFLYHTINNLVETREYKRHWNDLILKKVLIPNYEVMQAFSKMVIPYFQSINNLSKKNINLRRTRDLLLPKLISGELDVEIDIDTGGAE